ncbi:hypothetical protein WL766_10005 [Staphylococcus pasteuri]|uniref:hypothetical protein n=1 Tax=Staphylococcus TaxID=1279 RepID=UPI00030B3383|nr:MULTISPECIES: hypothetical protein [Staphylococcus]ODB61733.1 hypothetical protein A9N02_06590 [Staphylococcus sp. AOAB]RQX28114.1 hypothetical protein DB792_04250 [Staphylococcus warneri]MBM6506307.1 hypothetical protein [Staphylococcus pasteuri]MCD9066782.1 hypothetical protein [Staphylococcus pasteuri]MCO0861741.1 hypothetical protein [Staphylococcus pasteuri]
MEFKTITSANDPYFNEAIQIYDSKLDISLTEDSHIFKQSLENNKTEKDYAFIVGVENDEVVSMASAHYEATTNSAFLIYLITKNKDNHDEVMSKTLEKIEEQLNVLSNEIHDRDINFIMMEVPKEPLTTDEETNKVLERRRQFLYEHQFEKQTEIDYIHPNYTNDEDPKEIDLFIKANILLSKDIYGTSVKSNYILKYVFANRISRDIIYPLLEQMKLRSPL